MPELPEVETIRRYLSDVLPGQTIRAVRHLDARMVKHSARPATWMASALAGERFTAIDRQGKFLLLRLKAPASLVIHLGMSGRLVMEHQDAPWRPHTHLVLETGVGELRLSDPRRFGRIAWVEARGDGLPGLGMEPLSTVFSAQRLQHALSGRKVALKTALLNQSIVAGLGNIYADEALFRAGLHPQQPAGTLSDTEARRLVRAVREVLATSIEHRGTSFSDYVDALGHPGDNQGYLAVYGREGKPCPKCRRMIERKVLQGRSSHYCPRCQPLHGNLERGEDFAEF